MRRDQLACVNVRDIQSAGAGCTIRAWITRLQQVRDPCASLPVHAALYAMTR